MQSADDYRNAAAMPFLFGFVTIDLEQIAAVYAQHIERAEYIKAIASGEPASLVYARQRKRRPVQDL